jgi:hypothetical protein
MTEERAVSKIGEYARVTPEELDRALRDPQWAYDHVQDLDDADELIEPGDVPRCTDVDKAWDGIRFLLHRAGDPQVDVFGGAQLSGEDWGYGPARYLGPDEVGRAARHLLATPFEQLATHYDAARMRDEKIYPTAIWDENEDTLKYLRIHYEGLVEFFEAAATSGDAMILWLD